MQNKQAQNYRSDMTNQVPQTYCAIGKILALIVLLIIGISITGLVFSIISQPAKVVSKTFQSDNMIQNYEYFKQQSEDIDAMDIKIAQAEEVQEQFSHMAGPRKDWGWQDKEQYNRLTTVVLGLKQKRTSMAAEYDARSKMRNRSIFKDSDVPYRAH